MTEPDSIKQRMINKIKKLIRLSKSDNQAEAEMAAQRASELMQKYQIDESSVLLKDYEQDQITQVWCVVPDVSRNVRYIYMMARAACRLFDGEALNSGSRNSTAFAFVGFASDIPMMQAMFDHFYGSWGSIVQSDLDDAKDNTEFDFTPAMTLKFKQGHGVAFADVLMLRCVALQAQRKNAVSRSSSDGKALVLYKDQAVQEFGVKQKWVYSISKKFSRGSKLGEKYGVESGLNLPLGGGLTSEDAAKRIGTTVE